MNQTVIKKTISSTNTYNEKTYTSTSIKVRFIYKRTLIRKQQGEEVMSEAVVYTATALVEGDVVTYDNKDWTVRFVYPHVELDGSALFYKAVL